MNNSSRDKSTVTSQTSNDSQSALVRQVMHCVEKSPGNTQLQEYIATVTGLPLAHVSEQFAALTGQSLDAYIQQERMRLAQRMLLESSTRIAVIARAVGYDDVRKFSRVFQRHVGMTPSDFREKAPIERLISGPGMWHWE